MVRAGIAADVADAAACCGVLHLIVILQCTISYFYRCCCCSVAKVVTAVVEADVVGGPPRIGRLEEGTGAPRPSDIGAQGARLHFYLGGQGDPTAALLGGWGVRLPRVLWCESAA